MKKLFVLVMILISSSCFAQQFTFGPMLISEKDIEIESTRNILAWNVSGMILNQDAFVDYRVTVFEDKVKWQRVEIGMNQFMVKPFFSGDIWDDKFHAGGGLRVIMPLEKKGYLDLTGGGYDGGYLVSGKVGLVGGNVFFDLGYEMNKKGNKVYNIPSVRIGMRF